MDNIRRDLSRNKYLEIRTKFAQRVSIIKGVHSIYSCGNIDTPGVSDIDFVIFINKDFEGLAFVDIFKQLDDDEKFTVGCHYPFIVPAFIGEKFFTILPLSNLSKWDGQRFNNFKTPELGLFLKKLILIDICLYLYPNTFHSFLSKKDFRYREVFMAIKAFRFPLNMYQECFGSVETYQVVIDKINFLNKNILQYSSDEIKLRLNELIKLCYESSLELIRDIQKELSVSNICSSPKHLKYRYINGKNCIFTKSINGCKIVSLPLNKKLFLYNVIIYQCFEGCITDENFQKLRDDRVKIANAYVLEMSRIGLEKFIVWPPKSIHKIKNNFLKILSITVFSLYSIFAQ